MEMASARVSDDLYEWIEDRTETSDTGRTGVIREALRDARAVSEDEKVLLDPPRREMERLEEYADREGLKLDEAAEEVVRESLEDDGPATVGDLLAVVGRLPQGVRASLVGILLSSIAVVLFFFIISLEYFLDQPASQFVPTVVMGLLIVTSMLGVAFLVAGILTEVGRRILPVEAIERRLPGFRES